MKAFFIELVLRRLIQKVFSRILWGHMQWWRLHCMGWRFNIISNVYFCHRIMNLRVGPNKRKLLTFFIMALVFFIYCYPTDIWAPLNPTCWRTCISLLLRMNPALFREGALWETDQFSCLTSWYIEKTTFLIYLIMSPQNSAIHSCYRPMQQGSIPSWEALFTRHSRSEEAHGLLPWACRATEWHQ